MTVSSLLHSLSGWCFLTIFSSLHDETLICFNADVCCILIGCSCCVVQFSRIISLRDETREVKLTETSHRLNWYNFSNSGQHLKDDNSLSSNLTPEDISHTHHNITFILSTVYSQTQISQTDNGGSLRGGAAGDEDPPSYLTELNNGCHELMNPCVWNKRHSPCCSYWNMFYTSMFFYRGKKKSTRW